MGNFSNNAITDVGRMLLADVQAGAVFVPTRIVIGSGSMTGGATAQGMTDVITPVKSLVINKKRRTPDGKCVFGGVYTNEEITEPFYFRELALYAKAVSYNADGSVKSEGAETLYSYGNAGATADYMPAHSTSTVVEKQMDLVVWVGNDTQVNLTIESGINVTHKEFDNHASRHAIDGDDPLTPANIGAVNKAGDTLTGKLTIASSSPTYEFRDVVQGDDGMINTYSHNIQIKKRNVAGDDTNYRRLLIKDSTSGADVKTAIILGDKVNGVETFYDVIHKGNLSIVGLGAEGTWFDAKNIDSKKSNGWYYTSVTNGYYIETVPIYNLYLRVDSWKDATGASLVVQTLHHETHQIRRVCKNGVWGQWEWENPPMVTGVEYRTTERHNNNAVYKMVDSKGNILWRTWGGQWHLLASSSNVTPATVE